MGEVDPRPKLEYSFWVYYGRWREGRFHRQNFYVEEDPGNDRMPRAEDSVVATGEVNARLRGREDAAVLGRICAGDRFDIKEVSGIGRQGEYIWIRGRDRLWPGALDCPR